MHQEKPTSHKPSTPDKGKRRRSASWARGDHVEVLFNGEWMKAVVVKVAFTNIQVQYAVDGEMEEIFDYEDRLGPPITGDLAKGIKGRIGTVIGCVDMFSKHFQNRSS